MVTRGFKCETGCSVCKSSPSSISDRSRACLCQIHADASRCIDWIFYSCCRIPLFIALYNRAARGSGMGSLESHAEAIKGCNPDLSHIAVAGSFIVSDAGCHKSRDDASAVEPRPPNRGNRAGCRDICLCSVPSSKVPVAGYRIRTKTLANAENKCLRLAFHSKQIRSRRGKSPGSRSATDSSSIHINRLHCPGAGVFIDRDTRGRSFYTCTATATKTAGKTRYHMAAFGDGDKDRGYTRNQWTIDPGGSAGCGPAAESVD